MLEATKRTASFNILEFLPHHRRLRSQGCAVSQIRFGNMFGIFQGIEKLTFFEYGSMNLYVFQVLLQYTLFGRKVLPYSVAKALKPSSSDWLGIHFFLQVEKIGKVNRRKIPINAFLCNDTFSASHTGQNIYCPTIKAHNLPCPLS